METSDISHVKQEIVEPIKTKPNNEDGFDIFRISEIKTEDSNMAGDFNDTINYEAQRFQISDVERKALLDGFLPIKEKIKDESDTSNSVDEIVETEFKLYDSSFGIMDSKIEHFTAVDKSEVKGFICSTWKLKMENNLNYVKQQVSETYVEKEIKLEPEVPAELDPLEYVDMTVKSETLESCERESDELKPPEYVDVAVKSEVFESCESESINDLPSLKIKQEINTEDSTLSLSGTDSNKQQNVVDRSNCSETDDFCIIGHNIGINETCQVKEGDKNTKKGGYSKRRCGENDCFKQAYKGGYCIAHGGTTYQPKCGVVDCSKLALRGGFCIKHGGKIYNKKCGMDDCSKQSKKGGFCVSHGGENYPKKMCGLNDCFKQAQRGGYCILHGGRHCLNKCGMDDCSKFAHKGGYCITHGGVKYPRKKCSRDDCPKQAKIGGYCIAHSGMSYSQKCRVDDCSKQAKKGGYCCTHGGKAYSKKTCSADGCSKQAQKGGCCVSHGGKNYPRKTCGKNDCSKLALKGGYCIAHGGKHNPRKTCSKGGCSKQAKKGLYCMAHGGNRLESVV